MKMFFETQCNGCLFRFLTPFNLTKWLSGGDDIVPCAPLNNKCHTSLAHCALWKNKQI